MFSKTSSIRYVEFYGLSEPSDDIFDVLLHIAKTKNKTKQMRGFDSSVKKIYDIEASGQIMIKDFFDGKLGKSMLDKNLFAEKTIDLDEFV